MGDRVRVGPRCGNHAGSALFRKKGTCDVQQKNHRFAQGSDPLTLATGGPLRACFFYVEKRDLKNPKNGWLGRSFVRSTHVVRGPCELVRYSTFISKGAKKVRLLSSGVGAVCQLCLLLYVLLYVLGTDAWVRLFCFTFLHKVF